jgi:hypothetical protein
LFKSAAGQQNLKIMIEPSPCREDGPNFRSESWVPAERRAGHQDLLIATGYERRGKKGISTFNLMRTELKI